MSMYPPGVTTALVTAGTAIDFAGSPARNITVKVTPVLGGMAKSITHEATGGDMGISVLTYSSDDTGVVSFELPHTDQPGWVDGMQRPVPGWAYRAEVTINLPGGTLNKTKNFTIPTGQERVDLDRVADGQVILGVSAPAEVVSSVAGLTGSISRDALAEALGTVSGGGDGVAYDDSELRQRVEDLEDRPNPDFGQFVQQAALSSLYTAGEGAALEIRVDALEAAPDAAAYDDGPLTARVEALEQAPAPDLSGLVTATDLEATAANFVTLEQHRQLEAQVADALVRLNALTTAPYNASLYIPDGWVRSGARVAVVGDSHSDNTTAYGPPAMWWTKALPEAGVYAVPGRHGVEGWAGYSLNQMVYGTTGSGTGASAPLSAALADKPQTVVVWSGGNDAVQTSETVENYRKRFDAAYQRVTAAGAKMIYIFPPKLFSTYGGGEIVRTKFLELRAAARAKCEEYGVPYFDIWKDYPDTPASWNFGDNTHFNQQGHEIIGGLIGAFLSKVVAPAPLGSTPWGTGTPATDQYDGATAQRIAAPAEFTASEVYQLTAPAGGRSFVQTTIADIKAGERVSFSCRSKIITANGSTGGLYISFMDPDLGTPIKVFGPMRWSSINGRGGLTWVATKDYPAIQIRAAVQLTDATMQALVGDLNITRI